MEVEKTKTTFIILVLKVVYYVGLVFLNVHWEGSLFVKKVPYSANSALWICNLKISKLIKRDNKEKQNLPKMCCVHPFNFDVASWNFESMQSMNYDKIFFCYWAIDSDMKVDPECQMKLLSSFW